MRTDADRVATRTAAATDSRRRVLLIEDDHDIAEAITYQLEKVGPAGQGRAHRRGGPRGRAPGRRPRAARPQPARHGRARGLPHDPPADARTAHVPDHHRVRPRRRGGPRARPGDGRRRLRGEAVQPEGAGRPLPGRAAPHRAPAARRPQGYRDENFEVEFDSFIVRYRGEEIRLTHKEFELFRYLVERAGRVLTRERLLERVWGYETDVETRSIDAHIRRLRLKLGPGPPPRRDDRRPRLSLRVAAGPGGVRALILPSSPLVRSPPDGRPRRPGRRPRGGRSCDEEDVHVRAVRRPCVRAHSPRGGSVRGLNDDSGITFNLMRHGDRQVHDTEGVPPSIDQDWFRVVTQARHSYEARVTGNYWDFGCGLPPCPLFARVNVGGTMLTGGSVYSDDAGTAPSSTVLGTTVRWTAPPTATSSCACRPTSRRAAVWRPTPCCSVTRRCSFHVGTARARRRPSSSSRTTSGIPSPGSIHLYNASGTLVQSVGLTVPAYGVHVFSTGSLPLLAGQSGSAQISHDGGYGGLTGKAVALEPVHRLHVRHRDRADPVLTRDAVNRCRLPARREEVGGAHGRRALAGQGREGRLRALRRGGARVARGAARAVAADGTRSATTSHGRHGALLTGGLVALGTGSLALATLLRGRTVGSDGVGRRRAVGRLPAAGCRLPGGPARLLERAAIGGGARARVGRDDRLPGPAVRGASCVRVRSPRGGVASDARLPRRGEGASSLFVASLWPTLGADRPPVLLGLSERVLLAAYVAWLWTTVDATAEGRASA